MCRFPAFTARPCEPILHIPPMQETAMNTPSLPDTRIAIVTGGSRGLGRSTVLSLAQRGVACVFTYNANRAAAADVVAQAAERGARAVALELDVGQSATFDGFVERVRAALQSLGDERFDYLVNNAGISHHASIESTTEDEMDLLYRVNFKGPFFLAQKLIPLMRDGGRIVNLSSGLSRIIVPGSAPYGALKGALEVLTRYQAKEWGPRRITANAVAPGAIQTDFSGGMLRDTPELQQRVADMTALGRAGVPEDIGPMIAALLSDENRWVNAQRIEVSGGMAI
jgi:NAD(P)-dependent dehydrogenase (short-subunit alcohol dehydrogenase family)